MFAKFVVIFVIFAVANASVLPLSAPAALVGPPVAPVAPVAAAYAVAPYASSYSAHTVNHAVAEPVYAPAPVVAPARFVAPAVAPARFVAPAPVVAPAPARFVAPAPIVAQRLQAWPSANYISSPYYL